MVARWARYRAPDGRERSRSFRRRTDAERWLATQTADIARGAWIDPSLGRMVFGEWFSRWESSLVDLRRTTRAMNIHVARKYLLPRFERYALVRITTSDVKAMLADELAERRPFKSAIRRHVLVLRVILEAAVEDGRLGQPLHWRETPSRRCEAHAFPDSRGTSARCRRNRRALPAHGANCGARGAALR
jgi:hypothetical protein